MAGRSKNFEFEKGLRELEELVALMESGQVPLEESIKQFERATDLARKCEESLRAAEEKIEVLTASGIKTLKDLDDQGKMENNDVE